MGVGVAAIGVATAGVGVAAIGVATAGVGVAAIGVATAGVGVDVDVDGNALVCVGVAVDWPVGAIDGLLGTFIWMQPATPARTVTSATTTHAITTFFIIRLASYGFLPQKKKEKR